MERLPPGIITNILSRLPFRSAGQCRCVSKPWCSILTDSTIFPSIQLTNLSKIPSDILIFYKECTRPQTHYLEDNENLLNKTSVKPFKVIPITSFLRLPYYIGGCKGFIWLSEVVFVGFSFLPDNPTYVLNPVTGERAAIPKFKLLEHQGKKTDTCHSGMGFDETTKKHKLVFVMSGVRDKAGKFPNNEVQVYTFGSKRWRRKKGVVPDVVCGVITKLSDAFVEGCLHWFTIVPKWKKNKKNEGPPIVSFNVGLEQFGIIPTPDASSIKYSMDYCQLKELGDQLSLVEWSSTSFIDIWILKNYNVKESWVKQLSIKHSSVSHGVRCENVDIVKICNNGELLLTCDYEYLVSYNIASGKCRFLKVEGIKGGQREGNFVVAYSFVGSLLSLKSAYGMDTDTKETPSSTEKNEVPECRLS